MAKSLFDYISQVEKEYEYKIKFATEVTEKQFVSLENLLMKYDLIDVKNMIRLPIQRSPLDFPNLPATEVYVIDIVTRLPISDTTLVEEIHRCVGINMNLVIVRGKDSPYELELDVIEKRETEEYKAKIDDPNYETDGIEATDPHSKEAIDALVKDIKDKTGSIPTDNEKKSDSIFKKVYDQMTKSKSVLTDIDNPKPEAIN